MGRDDPWHHFCLEGADMNSIETKPSTPVAVETEQVFTFPKGLLGFEEVKRYVLLQNKEEEPFLWLQMIDKPSLAFLVVPPHLAFADYNPDFDPAGFRMLGIEREDQILLLSIVTLGGEEGPTANLKGPLVINRDTRTGAQLVVQNVTEYGVAEKLISEDSHNRIKE